MRSITYIAVFEPSSAGGFSVFFPDLPGCVTGGGSFREALDHAAEALNLHLYGMEADGDAVPVPSDVPAIDPETEPGCILSPVTIFPDIFRTEMENRAVRTNTTLPAWLKAAAEAQDINFSRVLQASLMEILKLPHPHV